MGFDFVISGRLMERESSVPNVASIPKKRNAKEPYINISVNESSLRGIKLRPLFPG